MTSGTDAKLAPVLAMRCQRSQSSHVVGGGVETARLVQRRTPDKAGVHGKQAAACEIREQVARLGCLRLPDPAPVRGETGPAAVRDRKPWIAIKDGRQPFEMGRKDQIVGIEKEEGLERRFLDPAVPRCRHALPAFGDEPDPGIRARQGSHERRRVVLRAVVDHDRLPIPVGLARAGNRASPASVSAAFLAGMTDGDSTRAASVPATRYALIPATRRGDRSHCRPVAADSSGYACQW